MPREPFAKFKMIRTQYAQGLKRGTVGSVYKAYSRWNERVFRYVQSGAPISKNPSKRFPVGFVKSHIKLVVKRKPPYSYSEIDVPGKYSRRSRAWRTWVIIKTLHEGWKRLPFERKPTRKHAMGLPVIQGARVPKPGQTKIAVKKVVQRKQITFNPWIKRTFEAMEWEFPQQLAKALDEQKKVTKKVKV